MLMAKEEMSLDTVIDNIKIFLANEEVPLGNSKMKLSLWYGTTKCAPYIGYMEIKFGLPKEFVPLVLRMINAVTPILNITIERKLFHVSSTEAFANKPCEESS